MSGDASAGGPPVAPEGEMGGGAGPIPGARRGRLGSLAPGLFAAIAFGAATPAAKVFLEGASPFAAAGWLYLSSGIALTLVLAVLRPGPGERVGRRDLPWLLASVIVGGTAAPAAYVVGLALAPASVTSLLLNLELPFMIAIAVLLYRERLDRWRLLGAALVTVGGVLVTVLSLQEGGGGSLVGALWIGAACLGWALDSNLVRFLAHRSALDVARWKGIGGGLAGFTLAALSGAAMPEPSARFVLGGAAVGFVAYGLSLAAYVGSVRRLGAARTGMLFGTAPLFGLLGSALFLGEPIGLGALGPAALMLLGVGLLGMERRPPSETGA